MSLSKFNFSKSNTNLSGGSLIFSNDGMKLYVAKNNIISQYKLSKPFDIETTTINQFCEKLQIIPTIIKCDIEGAEYQIYDDFIVVAKNKNLLNLYLMPCQKV